MSLTNLTHRWTNPIYPSSLAQEQNIFAITLDIDYTGLFLAAQHWMRENGFHLVTSWDKETTNWINYNSHNWHGVRDPGSPYQSPEWITVCKDCGLEDMGSPDEFDIEYPNCADTTGGAKK